MGPSVRLLLLSLALTGAALGELVQTEETVPVRLRAVGSSRSFRIAAFGTEFTLDLTPDASFVAPTLRVQRVKAARLSESAESGEQLRGCFYSGTVDSSRESVVAVSLCRGIRGSFLTRGQEYFIQPKVAGNRRSLSQVHVLRRRAATGPKGVLTSVFDLTRSVWSPGTGDAGPPRRERRFVSAARYIETLLVADLTMTRFYGDEIKHYLLTLMAMAAQIYRHPSLKNAVSLVVVKMLVVEDEEVGPEVSRNGGVALRNFCNWQQLFNPSSQRHPEHYDTAVLFTRTDICGHQHCDTLGVADVGTMCDPKRSCSVIEDNGLQAAFTVAHELGHVLSMPHDDSKNCEKWFGHVDGHHMMAPLFVHLNRTLPWSPCSALYVSEFFDNGHGDCLLDQPEQSLPLPAEPPGNTYGLDRQCQQAFGEDFAHCPDAPEVCSQLWCREEGRPQCTTRNGSLPWADGTPCGEGGTCARGACTSGRAKEEDEVPVDGGWGEWGPWGPCSRSCGGGVHFSRRECSDPEPASGGVYCVGQRVKYQSCNTERCADDHGRSFREEQCERYNSDRYLDAHGNAKRWTPKYTGVSPRDRCKLFCRAKGSNEFKVFEPKVIDGTTCGPDTTSICVQGQCVKAGCDQVIGSSLRLDKCGVCGGDGASCRKITGSLNKATYGYNDVVTIPAGATNIDIKQRSHRGIKHDGNYLALKADDGDYILNGNFSVSTAEQDIPVPGAVLRYSGSSTTLERILSFQKLSEAVTVQVLSTAGDSSPPRIKYTFFLPRDVPFSKPHADSRLSPHALLPFGGDDWVLGEWSECSKTCGSGWSRRSVDCRDAAGAASYFCDVDLRPADIRPCADLPCPVWQMGPWSACSRTCGRGERRRSVVCMDYTGKPAEAARCNPDRRPDALSGECFYQDCSS
ncbi:A disintegrin and metalloproteinase with thrombospondin motifs 8 [Denticeps clupeoides]|uniref:Peptidase M12B domain-containing protein n=1 Tax=Denticeps clupeoides TaxID=299321 RepID=A0AAY4DZQ8_9TELE|nr:A disintegrin and metalloproteinase with thrombospondin motifs 8 [Denticeps clupeoides]